MSLSENEVSVIRTCCELNQNLFLNVHEHDRLYVYRSRFLAVDFTGGCIVIDVPSAETEDAKPLSRGQSFEIYFECETFRYLFFSSVLDHTQFRLNDRSFYALKISLPNQLQNGNKREYFRVQASMRPPIIIKFTIFPRGLTASSTASAISSNQPEHRAEMIDVSGGGFSMRVKPGDKPFYLDKGDIIKVKIKFRADYDVIEAWGEVRNKRKYKDTDIIIWGIQFLGKEMNANINQIRNKVLRFVTERQREILSQEIPP